MQNTVRSKNKKEIVIMDAMEDSLFLSELTSGVLCVRTILRHPDDSVVMLHKNGAVGLINYLTTYFDL